MEYQSMHSLPKQSGFVDVVYKTDPSRIGFKLFFDKTTEKFLSKRGNNKTHKILKWKEAR